MSRLKISADTGPIKKSILDLNKELKNMGRTKVSVFSEQDRRFIKGELNKELSAMKAKLTENKREIGSLIKEQKKLEKGSKEELEHRKKIISAYRTQSRLAREIDRVQSSRSSMGGIGGMGGSSGGLGGLMGLLGKGMKFLGGAALGIAGMGIARGFQASNQYVGGSRNRVRLRGLGVEGDNFGSPEQLARAGLSEQDLIDRRIQATAQLGKAGGGQQTIMQQAMFERAFGLEGGAMTNVATSLRAQMGGRGADDAQMKLQASILASGMEEAIGPYLEAATDLLADINKNGMSNTDEMIRLFGQLSADNQRTPEQIAQAFQGINAAVTGATGEANAFFQTAFARGGIGGGTIGATRLAMQSGGIMGLSREELASRGYNEELLNQMGGAGFFGGAGQRTDAILDQFKQSAGLGKGQSINDVKDLNTMVGLSQMANSVLGTTGMQGFDALKLMEKVQTKEKTKEQFDEELKKMTEKKSPTVERLEKINNTLAGQTTIMTDINTNLLENLGKTAVKARNTAVQADNMIIEGTGNVAGAIDSTGALDASTSAMGTARKKLTGGGFGEDIYNWWHGSEEEQNQAAFKKAEEDFKKRKGNLPYKKMQEDASQTEKTSTEDSMARAVERGMTRAMAAQKTQNVNNNKVNVQIRNSDGRVRESTHK